VVSTHTDLIQVPQHCNVLPYGHRCATATMEIVEFPQWQIVTMDCRLSNNEGYGTRYSISVVTEGSLRNSEMLKTASSKRFDKPLHNEVEYSPRYSQIVRLWDSRESRSSHGQRQLIPLTDVDSWKAIEILNFKVCNSKRSAINIRYNLDNEKLFVAWHTQHVTVYLKILT
jgi:hypothetical protein